MSKKNILIVITLILIVIISTCLFIAIRNKKQRDRIEDTYNQLNSISESEINILDCIYEGWYFSIYDTKKTLTSKAYPLVNKLEKDLDINLDEQLELINQREEYNNNTDTLFRFDVLDELEQTLKGNIIGAIIKVYENRGTINNIEEQLKCVKENLKDSNNEDLINYYTEVSSLYEYIKKPSGSLIDLKKLKTEAKENIINYQSKLELSL